MISLRVIASRRPRHAFHKSFPLALFFGLNMHFRQLAAWAARLPCHEKEPIFSSPAWAYFCQPKPSLDVFTYRKRRRQEKNDVP